MKRRGKTSAPAGTLRVAIYTRQSVASDLEFGSIDAQREAIELFVAARRGEGWVALPDRFDDAGWSGKNTDRPAFQRLLAQVRNGQVDIVACYKLDRISRSVADLTRFVQLLDEHHVGFVASSQAIDTSGPTGRLLLHVLGSVAQFEREAIAERTRDKMLATRRRGMWTGGRPVLAYDVVDTSLVVNHAEAATVSEIFGLYLTHGSLLRTLRELDRRGIRNKVLVSQDGRRSGGLAFTKQTLHHLLTNPLYVGQVRAADELVEGRHEAIVDQATWDAVQQRLREGARNGSAHARNRWHAPLRGLVRCARCGSPMRHDATRRGSRSYRYYSCAALGRGADACAGSRAPAAELEAFVLERIRTIGEDPDVVDATLAAAREEAEVQRPVLRSRVRRLDAERRRLTEERDGLLVAAAGSPNDAAPALARAAAIDAELPSLDARIESARDELQRLDDVALDGEQLRAQLLAFDALWEQLDVDERTRLIGLVVREVRVDAVEGAIEIDFRGAQPPSQRTTA